MTPFTRRQLVTSIGLGLSLAAFGWTALRAIRRPIGPEQLGSVSGNMVIRFAHFHLESGIRETFETLAADYMRQHPGVQIEQLAVPQRTWKTWLRTQLVGGTAPDLIEIAPLNMDDDMLVQYFEPLTSWVNVPNPYNAGTALAGVPWRQTFVDGLTNVPAYNSRLMEFYAIPTTFSITRVAYNRRLMRELTGKDEAPDTYERFLEVCQLVAEAAARQGRPLVPITGSGYNMLVLLFPLFATQTQRLGQELDPLYTLNVTIRESAPAYLRGVWSLRSPAILDGLSLAHDVGQYVQPGFQQMNKQDAQFFFEQGRALFIPIPSRDLTSLISECPFEIGVITVPQPAPNQPRYGRNMLGYTSEVATQQEASFGLTGRSPHPGAAIDFLRFLTSQPTARRFTALSNWLPAVVGVPPNPAVAAFSPIIDGVTNGFGIHFSGYGAGHTKQLFDGALNSLFSRLGTPETFVESLERGGYRKMLVADIRRTAHLILANVRRTDTTSAAYYRLAALRPDDPSASTKLALVRETQNIQEAEERQLQHTLNQSETMP